MGAGADEWAKWGFKKGGKSIKMRKFGLKSGKFGKMKNWQKICNVKK